jgi:hypothetical protein
VAQPSSPHFLASAQVIAALCVLVYFISVDSLLRYPLYSVISCKIRVLRRTKRWTHMYFCLAGGVNRATLEAVAEWVILVLIVSPPSCGHTSGSFLIDVAVPRSVGTSEVIG